MSVHISRWKGTHRDRASDPAMTTPVPARRRIGYFTVAVNRLHRSRVAGAPSATWQEAIRLWPLGAAGAISIVLIALTLDMRAVIWARGLPEAVRHFFGWLTRYGESDWLLYPSGAICIVLLAADWQGVNRRIAAAWTEIGIIAWFTFFSVAGSGILVNIIKQVIGRGRPKVFDAEGVFSLLPLQFNYSYASFPSGHATTMGALAVVIALVVPRLAVPVVAMCGLVASSRVFVGSHYPSDVVSGFLLGAGFAWSYAHSLTKRGIGFARNPGGAVRARVVAIRTVFWQPRGPMMAVTGLWSAMVGRGCRTTAA